MFPLSARGRSSRCRGLSAAAVMIIPAVQKPHWNPWAARNASCSGCGVSPSIVVTAQPAARTAGNRQLCTGTPSTCTVHAPQSPASQPFLTPSQPVLPQERAQALAGARLAVDRAAVDDHRAGPGFSASSAITPATQRRVIAARQGAAPCTSSR